MNNFQKLTKSQKKILIFTAIGLVLIFLLIYLQSSNIFQRNKLPLTESGAAKLGHDTDAILKKMKSPGSVSAVTFNFDPLLEKIPKSQVDDIKGFLFDTFPEYYTYSMSDLKIEFNDGNYEASFKIKTDNGKEYQVNLYNDGEFYLTTYVLDGDKVINVDVF